jgi:type I restriction enzyme S subunit
MSPYLRAANVKDGTLDLTDIKEMNFSPSEQEVFSLRPGDILITEGSGSLSTVGASAVWSSEIEGRVCFQNTLLRLRPRSGTDPQFLAWWCRHAFASGMFAGVAMGANIFHLSAERVRGLPMTHIPIATQRAIADYLDTATARIDTLIEKKRRLVALMGERAESAIREHIACSDLVSGSGSSILIKRALIKHDRPADAGEMVTAFRDGQVTVRSSRRSDGYTEAWTEGAVVQGVWRGDVVVHGLDGFAGAIGTSEVDGICSPVYHVCSPAAGGDPVYFGRLLRILAVSGYLGLFASSTRERAVDFRNWELFGRIPIPEVPLAEQRKVASYIRRIKPLKDVVDHSVQLATEYRKALITNAVTGQIAIPGVAP